ncbi:MAG: sulfatase-like hydrolase/transferase [Burkholderiaceae bacterium]
MIGFPRGFSYAFGSLSLKINDGINHLDPALLSIATTGASRATKIVVIIDESITYEEMARAKPAADAVIDYGRAYSAANCSAASNYVLRKGGWLRGESVQSTKVFRVESLFSLARRAGFRTIYVDNQRVLHDPSTKNYFDADELSHVDQVIETSVPQYLRDSTSLLHIEALIGRDAGRLAQDKVFMLINKAGTHFPYRRSLHPAERSGDRLTDYRLSVRRNSTQFLERLAGFIDDDTLVFYTADHGQDFQGRNTHCMAGDEVSRPEYAVPMMLLAQPVIAAHIERREPLVRQPPDPPGVLRIRAQRARLPGRGHRLGVQSAEPRLEEPFCGVYGTPMPVFGVHRIQSC